MEIIKKLIQSPKITDSLFKRLDDIAQRINGHEYGLPIYKESHKALLRESLNKWIIENFEDEI